MRNGSDLPEVPQSAISSVLGMMDNQHLVESKKRDLIEDESISTCKHLIAALKDGRIPGNAIIEWRDSKGKLRVNIIDFLLESKVKATDPASGESVIVETEKIPDRTWRVLY